MVKAEKGNEETLVRELKEALRAKAVAVVIVYDHGTSNIVAQHNVDEDFQGDVLAGLDIEADVLRSEVFGR